MLHRLLTLLKRIWAWLLGRDWVPPASDKAAPYVPAPPSEPTSPLVSPSPSPQLSPTAAPIDPIPPPPTVELGEPELGAGVPEPPIYRKKDRLFSFQERKFYKLLQQEVGADFHIFAKVRMGDIVFLANEPLNRKYYNNQVWGKHFDFLLCDKMLFQPLLAIELDDSSHRRYDSRQSDALKDHVCQQTGLPLVRFEVRASYPQGMLRTRILAHLPTSLSED